MNLSRRSFMVGLAATTALSQIGAAEIQPLKVARILHGDGISDDTAAMQALINDEPVIYNGELLASQWGVSKWGKTFFMPRGAFRIRETLDFSNRGKINIQGAGIDETRLIAGRVGITCKNFVTISPEVDKLLADYVDANSVATA
jgi:hypothetical protein